MNNQFFIHSLLVLALLLLRTVAEKQIYLNSNHTQNEKLLRKNNRNLLYLSSSSFERNKKKKHPHKRVLLLPFQSWDRSKTPFPCTPPTTSTTSSPSLSSSSSSSSLSKKQGIFYIKVPKTSSGSLAQITERIAVREASRSSDTKERMCQVHDPGIHQKAHELEILHRDKKKSILWTMIRHPADRVLSHLGMFHAHNELDVVSSDSNVMQALKEKILECNIQLSFIYPSSYRFDLEDPHAYRLILEEYNFIGIYERYHESLVVFAMLMGLKLSDVLYEFHESHIARCSHNDGLQKRPSWVTTKIEDYLTSDEWLENAKGDYKLYEVVNKSLNWTIERLGKGRVEEKVQQFEKILDIAARAAMKMKGVQGCGVLDISTNFGDLENLPWFQYITPDEQSYIRIYG